MAVIETNGPDPCRKNLQCLDFHDSLGRKSEEYGGTYNCCCCDPCRFIHPISLVEHVLDDRDWCCKCVPRGLLLTFTAGVQTGTGTDDCCRDGATLMLATQSDEGRWTEYTGSLFGNNVTVKIGDVVTTGTGTPDSCGWEISIDGATGTSDTQTFAIDHDSITCLYVPDGITLADVEGPNGCTGTLGLLDLAKARIPFRLRDVVQNFDGSTKFVDISHDPCGNCQEVCRVLCATGYRHDGGAYEYKEFEWFDDYTGTGTGRTRGWAYDNPITGYQERLLLVEEDGQCKIIPDFEDPTGTGAEELYPGKSINDARCGCSLKEDFPHEDTEIARPFQLRCGFCGCYEFYCGKCRCVPYELCVNLFDGETFYAGLLAVWNPTDKSWDVNETGTGTGTDSDWLKLQLYKDEKEQCSIKVMYEGVEIENDNEPTFTCDETITHEFTGEQDILNIEAQLSITVGSGTGTDERPFWLVATSHNPYCGYVGPCTEATPCVNECGSHPAQLTVTIRQWVEPGDASGSEELPDNTWEIELYYVQQMHIQDMQVITNCWYVGFSDFQCSGCSYYVELRSGEIEFTPKPAGCGLFGQGPFLLATQTCDPYYGDTGVLLGWGDGPIDCEGGYRTQITITE